jgi:hypothetical protein
VNDLEALVASSHTRDHVAELVRDFTLGKIGKHVQETEKIADPLVKALELEGSQALGGVWCNSDYPTNAQCNYPKYPDFSLPGGPAPAPSPPLPSNCICGSKWITDYASPLIATDMQSFHVHTSDAFHDVSDEHPFHLPHIWNECEVPNEDCTLNVTSLTMLVEGSTDFFPNVRLLFSFFYVPTQIHITTTTTGHIRFGVESKVEISTNVVGSFWIGKARCGQD